MKLIEIELISITPNKICKFLYQKDIEFYFHFEYVIAFLSKRWICTFRDNNSKCFYQLTWKISESIIFWIIYYGWAISSRRTHFSYSEVNFGACNTHAILIVISKFSFKHSFLAKVCIILLLVKGHDTLQNMIILFFF